MSLFRRRKPAKPETYVRVACRLARHAAGGVISAGQVAYHAHHRIAGCLDGVDLKADAALSESGLFQRASFLNRGRFGDITLWRLKAVQS